MITCVDCGYVSDDGLLHFDYCRLILLQWINIEGCGGDFCEFKKLDSDELADLSRMENEMVQRGAVKQPDGYFGTCVVPKNKQT